MDWSPSTEDHCDGADQTVSQHIQKYIHEPVPDQDIRPPLCLVLQEQKNPLIYCRYGGTYGKSESGSDAPSRPSSTLHGRVSSWSHVQ
jgi:hypothetical protein